MEIWKDIKGYEGIYQVSNLGRVKSLPRIVICSNGCKKNYKSKILKSKFEKDGYLRIGLTKFSKETKKYIHRLVAETFVPNPNNYSEVNHIDENKSNNKAINLEWCTRKYNMNYGNRIKKQVAHTNYKKIASKIDYKALSVLQKSATQKAVYQYSKEYKFIKRWSSFSQVENELGIHHSNIVACCTGRRKSTGGYIWSYTKL